MAKTIPTVSYQSKSLIKKIVLIPRAIKSILIMGSVNVSNNNLKMNLRKPNINYIDQKIFLNNLNSWFSNFIIEEFRTDYLPENKIQTIFTGTMDPSGGPLPKLFEPNYTTIELGYDYSQDVFNNDVFIFNLDDSYLPEVEFVIRGLQNIEIEKEKILILVSNVMTWGETPLKVYTEEDKNSHP